MAEKQEALLEEVEEKSFAKALFAGRINQDLVTPFPRPEKEEDEFIRMILDNLHKFADDHIDSKKIDQEGKIPKDVLRAVGEMGLFGLQIPERFGGIGLSQMGYGRVFEEIGAIDSSLAVTLGAHQSIGLKGLLLFGNDEQKERYLPKLAKGESIAGFALTEPGSGSDAYSISTRAVKQADGSWILNGNKLWITNGGIGDFFTVFAKTEVETKKGKKEKVTAFLVTRDMEGFSSGKEEKKLGIHGSSTTALSFTNLRIPPENILGELGRGFHIAMEILNSGRLGLATGCVGGAKQMLKVATKHAMERKQFGKSLSEFGLIKEKLAAMVMDTFVTESIAYLTCGMVDRNVPDYSVESAICKISGSLTAWNVANEATQIAGGSSYMQEYPYEQALRDSRINMIFEGTNEILTLFIALSGIKQVAEYVKVLGTASLDDPIKSLGVLYDYFVARKVSRSLYGPRLLKIHPQMKRETSWIEDHVKELVIAVEKAILRHRKKLIDRQFALQRITNIVIDIYKMIAVSSRVTSCIEEKGVKGSEVELNLVRAFCCEATARINRNFRSVDRNTDEYKKKAAADVCRRKGYPTILFPK